MSRTTIDFGIDLGTTNSAIAILRGADTEIIKNNDGIDITSSAVFINKNAKIQVGFRAKARQEDEKSADDVYIEFKRLMGTDNKYEFKASGRTMKPEELSAEVLKTLRGDVQQRLVEDVKATVITVPAVFKQQQCAATRKAGELAGFSQCPLLQEPVAASLAFGFQADMAKEYWLMYDFGGGTFDAAIMKAEEGSIIVVNHGGDNRLGGSDIDWAIVDQLVIPELVDNYDLPDFSRGNKKWATAFAKIKHAVEDAKIQLSRGNKANIESSGIKDAQGEEIEIDIPVTRDALISVAEPFIISSVKICKRVLQEKNLGPDAIERIILVGGPTSADYFREMLDSSLGIQLDYSVDPLTVVARGAAIFAGTQRIEGKAAPKAVAGQFNISLFYKTMGPDRDPKIRGLVKSMDNSSVEGFTVEFVNQTDGAKDLLGWRSGKITLKADGKFILRLEAEEGLRNTYTINLLDSHGSTRTIVPDTVVYTMTGAAGVISEQPIINSIAVALANNDRKIFFNKGEPLDAKKTEVFYSAHALSKGESGEVLKCPVVEGEMEKADHNSLLGFLEISGESIKRDLPAGAEIELTLVYDASRILTAKAYVLMLDEEFEAVIEPDLQIPKYAELKNQFEMEERRHEEIIMKVNDTESKSLEILVEDIEEPGRIEEIEKLVDAGRADPDAAKHAEERLLELRINHDKAEDLMKWPSLVTEANQEVDDLYKLIEEYDMPEYQERADKLREQVEDLVSQERAAPLRKKIGQIKSLYNEILFLQPSFWVGYFGYLEKQRANMTDTGVADRLCNQGYQCIQKEDINGLRNVVRQLLNLLPQEEVVEEIKRGYESGLLK